MITLVTGYNLEAQKDREGAIWMPLCHAHPSKQSLWARSAVKADDAERTTVIITNSDHILNGLRLGVCVDGASVPKIEYINELGEVQEIHMNRHGRMDKWPKGFFDQIETDLSQLLPPSPHVSP